MRKKTELVYFTAGEQGAKSAGLKNELIISWLGSGLVESER